MGEMRVTKMRVTKQGGLRKMRLGGQGESGEWVGDKEEHEATCENPREESSKAEKQQKTTQELGKKRVHFDTIF